MRALRLIIRLVLVAAALGAIGIGWWAYWQTATDQFQVALENWASQQRALGRTVEYEPPVFSGFPFAIRAEIREPRIAMPAQGFGWQGPTLQAEASPFDPLTIDIHAPGEHRLVRIVGAARSELAVQATALTGQLDLSTSTLEAVSLSGEDLHATDSLGQSVTVGAFEIDIGPADHPPASFSDLLLRFAFRVDDLSLPPLGLPLGDRIDSIAAEGRIMGPMPPGTPAAALDVWRRAGGTLEIDAASGLWGPTRFEGDGTFALDEQLQPQGAATVLINGYEPALAAMKDAGYLTEEQANIGTTMLDAFAREPEDGGLKEVRLPVTLQNRKLLVGPIEFARIPTIEWPDR